MAEDLQELAEQFWTWRVAAQPESSDDITRVERPSGWRSDWLADAVEARRAAVREFARRHARVDVRPQPVPIQVNARLLGSAIARAYWELELLRGWRRDPRFYVDQSLVPVYNALLDPAPFDEARTGAVLRHLRQAPVVLEVARVHLDEMTAPAAEFALAMLAGLDDAVRAAVDALVEVVPTGHRGDLRSAAEASAGAVRAYERWLQARRPDLPATGTAVGSATFAFYLHRVALLPYDAEQLGAMGRQEWDRAGAGEALVQRRGSRAAEPAPAADLPALIARQAEAERAVRAFYVEHGLLSQPESLRHYRFAAMPAYLDPLTRLGVAHYTGSPSRPGEDAVHYAVDPHGELPYFRRAEARDPRAAIVHEGVHAQQLAMGWAHPDPARRRFYDSVPNEGLAFYNEEMMVLAGLLDDAPATIEFVFNAMRLRALRVEIDLALATGTTTIEAAADRLATAVPMDELTAREEATFFAGNPGQALSYQIGKLQITALLADARTRPGFDLQRFHDRLWREGNVPLALQRWELLGSRRDVDAVDRLAEAAPDPT